MDRSAKPGNLCRSRRGRADGAFRAFRVWVVFGLSAGLAGPGCSLTHPATAEKGGPGDPLLGPSPATLAQPVPPTPPAGAPGGAQSGALAPIPPSAGLTTTAALASQTPTPQALAIGDNDGWQRNIQATPAAGSGTPHGAAMPVSQPKVVPVPKDSSFTASSTPAIQPTASWSAASQAAPTAEQLDAVLKGHGVIAQKQYPDPAGVRLVCAVPNASNSNRNEIYDVTATDYAAAVQAIVQQIDRGRGTP